MTEESPSSDSADATRRCAFLDDLRHGVVAHDGDGLITFSNHAHHALLGYVDGELVGRSIWELQPTDEGRDALRKLIASLKSGQPLPSPYITENKRKDGIILKVQHDWNYLRERDGRVTGFVSIVTDVSDNRLNQKSLSQYSHGVATLLDVSRRLVATLDLEQILQATADGVCSLAGLDTAAIYLLEDTELHLFATNPPLPPDFPDALRVSPLSDHPHLARTIRSGEPVLLPDALTATLTPAEQSAVTSRSLRTILYLPLIAEDAVLGAFIVGSINTPTTILEDKVRLAFTFANLAALATKNAQLYKAKKHYASKLERALAEQRQMEEEREALRSQLFQVQKMDAVGRLAGGIAHDFNNQLGGIMGFAELLMEDVADERLKKFAGNIVSLAQRSADLTAQLLAFARKGKHRVVKVDLHEVIEEVVSIVEHTTHHKIVVRKVLDAASRRTTGDPTQIQSALLNLAVNAKDAMPDGGELIFRTQNIQLSNDNHLQHHVQLPSGAYIQLSVADTGIGMDASIMERVFEPFFTTKERGRGTGMGLAAVYGTLKTHGGDISVESTPGHGTTFHLYFPLETAIPGNVIETEAPTAAHAVHEILIVDDEEMIANAAAAHLSNVGYTVHTFTDSQKAFAFFGKHYATLALVIVDMIMPGMDGPTLYNAMRAVNPQLRAIIISGFSIDEKIRNMLDNGAVEFLQKPFRRTDLLKAATRALGPQAASEIP